MESSDGGGFSKNEDRGAGPDCVAHRTKGYGRDLHLRLLGGKLLEGLS